MDTNIRPTAHDFERDLKRSSLPTRIVMGQCQGLDMGLRNSPLFQDPGRLPFYFYLGKRLPRTSVVNFGFGIGLPLAMFLSTSPAQSLAHQQTSVEYYHPRLGIGNVKRVSGKKPKVFYGDINDSQFIKIISERKWGSALVCDSFGYDKTIITLQTAWDCLADDGYVVVDRIDEDAKVALAFDSFCTIVSRRGMKIKSRTGHGLVFRS